MILGPRDRSPPPPPANAAHCGIRRASHYRKGKRKAARWPKSPARRRAPRFRSGSGPWAGTVPGARGVRESDGGSTFRVTGRWDRPSPCVVCHACLNPRCLTDDTNRSSIPPLPEGDLLRGLVPGGLFLVLKRQRGQVAADGGLLSDRRRRDGLLFAQHAHDEVAKVIEHAVVGLIEILAAQRDRLAVLDVVWRLASKQLRGKGEFLPVHDFDGAFVAENLLAVAVVIVAEVAGVVDVELR